MKKVKNRLKILVGILVLIVVALVLLEWYMAPGPGKYIRGENTLRSTHLKQLWQSAQEYVEIAKKQPNDLFTVLSYNSANNLSLPYSITMPYGENDLFLDEYLKNETKFKSVAQYEIIRIGNDKWGIIELDQGKFGKYYFVIDQNGVVYKLLKFDIAKVKSSDLFSINLAELIERKQAVKDFVVIDPPKRR